MTNCKRKGGKGMRPQGMFGFFFLIVNCFMLGLLSVNNALGSGASVKRVPMTNTEGTDTAEADAPAGNDSDGTEESESSSGDSNPPNDAPSDVRGTDSGDW
jgi:hypothetical protein